jgi:hypothetical protein
LVLAVYNQLPSQRELPIPFGAELQVNRSQVRYERRVRDTSLSRLRPCRPDSLRAVNFKEGIHLVVADLIADFQSVTLHNQMPDPHRRLSETVKVYDIFTSFSQYHQLFELGVFLLPLRIAWYNRWGGVIGVRHLFWRLGRAWN